MLLSMKMRHAQLLICVHRNDGRRLCLAAKHNWENGIPRHNVAGTSGPASYGDGPFSNEVGVFTESRYVDLGEYEVPSDLVRFRLGSASAIYEGSTVQPPACQVLMIIRI